MTDYEPPHITRRDALKGGSAAAVAVGAGLLSNQLVRRAKALEAGDARIVMGDQGESPAQDGEITHNSGDVEIYSGGAVRNLTTPTFELVVTEKVSSDTAVYATEYASLQAAIDDAVDGSTVFLGPQSYNETISTSKRILLMGSGGGGAGATIGQTLTLTGTGAKIIGVRLGGGIALEDVAQEIRGCNLGGAVSTDNADQAIITSNQFNGNDITLDSTTDNAVVVANAKVGTVTDNGTGDEVSSNS